MTPCRPLDLEALVLGELTPERARERNALSDLDDRLLHDVGVSRDAAEREWRKPFWRAR